MKKVLSIFIYAIIMLSVLTFSACATESSFTDVNVSDWYYEDVKNAVKQGLIQGKDSSTYAPNDNITYAETVKLASRVHKLISDDKTEFDEGKSPWYSTYVEYAQQNYIIHKEYAWNEPATRAEFLNIFSRAIPKNRLNLINSVPDWSISDVSMTHPYSEAIYSLYRAGIVQGSDENFNCYPESNIIRAEVASILTRIIDPAKRIKFEISLPEYRTLYHTGYAAYDEKIHEYKTSIDQYLSDSSSYDWSDYASINKLMIFYSCQYGRADGEVFKYALYDVDSNGIPELLFTTSAATCIIDMYALDNGNIVKLFPDCFFGERTALYISSDGTIFTDGSGGAFSSFCSIYKLNSNGYYLDEFASYYYDTGNTYSNYIDDKYVLLSKDQYDSILNSHMQSSIFDKVDWNNFAEIQQ